MRHDVTVIPTLGPALATSQSMPGPTSLESSTLLELLLSRAPVGFGFVDRDHRFVRMNDTLAAINGATIAAQLGRLAADVLPDLWAQLEPRWLHVVGTGESVVDVEVDAPGLLDTTQQRHWLASYYPVSVGGEIIGIGIVTVDITERKRSEEVRRQLAAIVDSSGDAIFGADLHGLVTSWNAAAERLWGYPADEIIGRPADVLADPSSTIGREGIRARLRSGGPAERAETRCRRRDGSSVDVVFTASSVSDPTGRVVGLSVIVQDITERRAAQGALQAGRRRLEEAQRLARLGSFEHDLLTGEQVWSDVLYEILGIDTSLPPSPALFGKRIHPDDRSALLSAWSDATDRGIAFDLVYRIVRVDGEVRWIHARARVEASDDGTVDRVVGTLMDDTERFEADRVRREAETLFEIGFEQAGIGAGILDLQGIPLRVNAAVCAILGRPESQLVGQPWTLYHHPDDDPLGDAVLERVSAGHDSYADDRRYLRPDGSIVWASLHICLVRDEHGEPAYYLGQLQDITARKEMEQALAYQARHDSLTGLPNRALLTERLALGLSGTRRRDAQLGVIFLDVDHFKVVNDSFGHTYGDDLLKQAAQRITAMVRPEDTVARFGGDEFVVVCHDISEEGVTLIGQRILEALAKPCFVARQEVSVTASIGIALADDDATPESLLRDSDAAMYLAKSRGRARIELFDEVLRTNAEGRIATVLALRRALERDEFIVHYQPIVDLSTGAMLGAEALVRWEHPTRGLVGPDTFIPLAEDTGLIVPLGIWVLEQACRQLVEWQRTDPSLTVAVNLSVRQVLEPDIVDAVADVLARTGAPARNLCLELTESGFMADVEYFGKALASLKCLGVKLAIDDFGTGYSSLSYLKRFPVDSVKVDRCFVEALGHDSHHSALVAAIVAMADALDLEVVAEGVETREQLDCLRQLQCQRAQGFYLAHPMPAAAIGRLVEQSHRWLLG